jgi:hypothetical protein
MKLNTDGDRCLCLEHILTARSPPRRRLEANAGRILPAKTRIFLSTTWRKEWNPLLCLSHRANSNQDNFSECHVYEGNGTNIVRIIYPKRKKKKKKLISWKIRIVLIKGDDREWWEWWLKKEVFSLLYDEWGAFYVRAFLSTATPVVVVSGLLWTPCMLLDYWGCCPSTATLISRLYHQKSRVSVEWKKDISYDGHSESDVPV